MFRFTTCLAFIKNIVEVNIPNIVVFIDKICNFAGVEAVFVVCSVRFVVTAWCCLLSVRLRLISPPPHTGSSRERIPTLGAWLQLRETWLSLSVTVGLGPPHTTTPPPPSLETGHTETQLQGVRLTKTLPWEKKTSEKKLSCSCGGSQAQVGPTRLLGLKLQQ